MDDDAFAKGRAQYARRMQPVYIIMVFVLGLCALEMHRDWDPLAIARKAPDGSVRSFRDEFEELQEGTKQLSLRLDKITTSLTTLSRDLNTELEASEEAKENLHGAKRLAKKKAKELHSYIQDEVEAIQDKQKADMEELKQKIDQMPKCAGTPSSHQDQSTPLQDFNQAHQADGLTYNRQYDPNQQAGNPTPKVAVPDPCADLDSNSNSNSDSNTEYESNSDSDTSGSYEEEDGSSSSSTPSSTTNLCRRKAIKDAFKWGWNAYKRDAWGHDELMPLSRHSRDWGRGATKGLGLTMLDGISTLWLMGLKEEFHEVRGWVEDELDFHQNYDISVFESTIRMVGSMVSAYEMSGEKYGGFLKKAAELADILLHAYNTSNGIPHATINLFTKQHANPSWTGGSSVLSEFATVQLELRTLSLHTKNSVYDEKATWIMDIIEGKAPADFLCPTYFSTLYARWTSDHITLGALGDSYYEYLLKQYLLTGQTETRYRDMYLKALRAINSKLVRKSTPSGMTYVAEFKRGSIYNKMDHLACFTGGMFALGTMTIDSEEAYTPEDREKDLKTAEELAETCYMMYKSQPTGISPEIVEFRGGGDMVLNPRSTYYILRPEAVETFMYLYRATKKQKYREYAWDVFIHIEKWCKVESGGYSGIRNVGIVPPQKDDLMQSFWFAETLKYLYIIFSDDDLFDFKKWVLNTEAHPLRIRDRDPKDIWPESAQQKHDTDSSKEIDERLYAYKQEFEQRSSDGGGGGGGYGGGGGGGGGEGSSPPSPRVDPSTYMQEQERLVKESRERHDKWQKDQDENYRKSLDAQQTVAEDDSDRERLNRLRSQRNT